MSLNAILGAASSGLFVSQAQLRVISDNIANVNTPGYTRKTLDQNSNILSAGSGGVSAGRVGLAVDQFLQQASLSATAKAGGAAISADMMDRAQALFGDPSTTSSYFSQLDNIFSSFASAAQDPSSSVTRNTALSSISSFLDQTSAISAQLKSLTGETESRIGADVSQVNDVLDQISQLNRIIARDGASGGDVTGAQNSQGQLVNTLSSMMDITVTQRPDGSIDIRGGSGAPLVSQVGAAKLAFSTTGPNAGQLTSSAPGGSAAPLTLGSGELKGLVDLRNTGIPAVQQQLSEYVTRAVDQINIAHNASSAAPPPNKLTGRNTGLDLPTAVSGFTGKTSVSVVNSSGVIQTKIAIDFDAGTITADSGTPATFTPANFLSTLNTALGSAGTASFSDGALSLQGASGYGVAIADDPTTPSDKAGKGFSAFFGMNDLITSTGYPFTATGLSASDLNGFNAGGVVTLRLTDANGAPLRDAAVTVPSGGTVGDLVTALNSNTSGVGYYGAFSLDSDGRLTFASNQPGVSVDVLSDTSQRGTGGPPVSQLFGIDPSISAARATSFSIRSDILADSGKLALAQFDTTAVAGQQALSKGDGRGAQLLAAVGDLTTKFDAAGSTGALSTTLSQWGAQFAGSVAQSAASAATAQTNATAVSQEADSRRSSVEGVNLDEELIKLTTYQQSYNASARLLQAVSDLYDTLLKIT